MSDFYGIELRGTLVVPDKTRTTNRRYELWTGNSITDPDIPAALADIAYVQDISIQIGLALNSKVSLTLTPPLEEGLELIHSPLLNWGGSMLEVKIGYSTGGPVGVGLSGNDLTLQSFGGLVMKPDVRIGQDITITINALGVAYGMNLSHMTTARTFPAGWSPWQAVRETLKTFNYDIDDSNVFDSDIPSDARDPNNANALPFFKPVPLGTKVLTNGYSVSLEEEYASIDKGPRNDWWFIRETIKNYGLDMIIIDQQVKIRDPQAWKMEKPKFTFVMQGNLDTGINSNDRIYPILEFNTPSYFVWLANGSGGLLQSDVSFDKKQELTAIYTSAKPKSSSDQSENQTTTIQNPSAFISSGIAAAEKFLSQATVKKDPVDVTRSGTGAADATGSTNDAASVFPGSPEDSAADQAIGEYRNYSHSRGIQAEITSLGIPELMPATVIYVDGMAPPDTPVDKAWFDGPYGIMLVEHNIGTSGMVTKFRALKNFIPTDMQGATDEVSGQVSQAGPDSTQSPDDNVQVSPDQSGQ